MSTLPDLQARLDLYVEAERKILAGHQSVTAEGTAYARANLGQLQSEIRQLEWRIKIASGRTYGHIVFGGRG